MPNGKLRADVALYHHERLNGSGYIGLRGKAICKAARIVAIADAFEAMNHDRPYRNALSQPEAIKELIRQSGFLFDERYVHSLLEGLNSQHMEIKDLDRPTVLEMIESITISEARKVNGKRHQNITINYRFIGNLLGNAKEDII